MQKGVSIEPRVKQEFDPRFDSHPELKQLVKMAAGILAEETEDTYSPAVATWSLRTEADCEPGQLFDPVSLYLYDPELHVYAARTFSTNDLQSPYLTGDILRVWGKFLERRSALRIDRMMQELREEGNDLK